MIVVQVHQLLVRQQLPPTRKRARDYLQIVDDQIERTTTESCQSRAFRGFESHTQMARQNSDSCGSLRNELQVLVGNLLHECLQENVDHLQKRHFSSRSNDGQANVTQIIRRTIGSIKRIHGLNETSQQNRQELAENMRTWEAAERTSAHQEENG